MVVPRFVGAEVVKAWGLGNAKGFIGVKDTYQTLSYPNVCAVGIATAVNAPWQSANAVGVPKTGFPVEHWHAWRPPTSRHRSGASGQARRRTSGDKPAVCINDAGNNGVVILADRHVAPQEARRDDPRPPVARRQARIREVLPLEVRHGYVQLP